MFRLLILFYIFNKTHYLDAFFPFPSTLSNNELWSIDYVNNRPSKMAQYHVGVTVCHQFSPLSPRPPMWRPGDYRWRIIHRVVKGTLNF